MIRGTTPTITITFDFATSTIDKIRVYFMQGNETLLTKEEADCTFSGNNAVVELTEEETYALSAKKRLELQTRALLTSGKVIATSPIYVDVENIGGEEEVLVDAE